MEVLWLEERYGVSGAVEAILKVDVMFHLGLFKIFKKVKTDFSQLI